MSRVLNPAKLSDSTSGKLNSLKFFSRKYKSNAFALQVTKRHHPCRHPRSPLSCTAMLSADTVFNMVTVAVMPFYGMMIAAPQKPITRKLMASKLPFYCAAALYLALLFLWNPLENLWNIIKASTLDGNFALRLPDMTVFATAFNSAEATTLAWLHLVTLDLFQAR
jgi:hypothetical protein